MISPQLAHLVLCLIVGISILLMLVRPRNIAEVYWISAGALLLIMLRLIPLALAGKAVAEGSDVYLFLIGMMLLSALAQQHGVFDWVSSVAVRKANHSSTRLFTLIYGIGIVVTICMSNDATAVVLTPAILAAVRKAKVAPLPYLFACAFIANAASFVLPISNPANLVVYHQGMPPLGQWLSSFALPSALSILVTYGVLRFYFRTELQAEMQSETEQVALRPEGKLVVAGLGFVVAVLLTASALKQDLGLPACLAALLIAAVISVKSRTNPRPLLAHISWSTLLLVAGLFILVDAVESIGLLDHTQRWLHSAQHLAPTLGVPLVGITVAVANNLVNNLPLGLIAGATLHAAHVQGVLAHAVLIGVDLGPNLSITGSLATILWLLALRKENLNVSFWSFLKVGALAMPAALLCSLGGSLAMQALFPALH